MFKCANGGKVSIEIYSKWYIKALQKALEFLNEICLKEEKVNYLENYENFLKKSSCLYIRKNLYVKDVQ
jgi:hypothetical protein